MKFPWKKIGGVAFKVVMTAIEAVGQVEHISDNEEKLTSAQKQKAALDFLNGTISRFGDDRIKLLADNLALQEASRQLVDAVVNWHNVAAEELEKL